MTFGLNMYNEQGVLTFSNNSVMYIEKTVVPNGTIITGEYAVRATNTAAGIYKNPKTNNVYTTDGGTITRVRLVPVNPTGIANIGYGMLIRNGSDILIFDSALSYPAIAFNQDVLWHNDLGPYSAPMIATKPNRNYYILISSLGMATYNKTLNGNTNAFMMTAYFTGNTFSFTQTSIVVGPGGSGNYTRAVNNHVVIIQG
jgi:hypothetical protein